MCSRRKIAQSGHPDVRQNFTFRRVSAEVVEIDFFFFCELLRWQNG
jgi:hypothetical protein